MTMTDNKNGAPLEHYRALFSVSEPEALSLRSGVKFESGAFRIRLLGREVSISHPDMTATYADDGSAAPPSVTVLLSRLILEGTLTEGTGRFCAYSELPWGSVYNAQFTARCIRRLAAAWGNRPDALAKACEALGGTAISGADTAYELPFIEGLRLRLYLWSADEEFPASAQLLFSDNFAAAFSAEDIAVAGDILILALKKALEEQYICSDK